MSEIILNIERGGHQITMDRREGYLRVNCNGVTHVKFNELAIGEIPALRHAIDFVEQLEQNALMHVKTKQD